MIGLLGLFTLSRFFLLSLFRLQGREFISKPVLCGKIGLAVEALDFRKIADMVEPTYQRKKSLAQILIKCEGEEGCEPDVETYVGYRNLIACQVCIVFQKIV